MKDRTLFYKYPKKTTHTHTHTNNTKTKEFKVKKTAQYQNKKHNNKKQN
jgi:hypothetical protein